MPASDVRGPPFSTTLEILGLFPYLAKRQTFIAKLRSITPYFRPQCLGFDFGYFVRIERLSGKRWGKLAGGFPRSKENGSRPRCIAPLGKSRSSRSRQIQKKAEAYFNRALAAARQQQAKSWEL
jgi:hypothetical protein